MKNNTRAFARFEWMIAWRYLKARRVEGGVSVMTWISLLGIALAVFALVATLAVRSGFRHEFVNTILGASAHITLYSAQQRENPNSQIEGYDLLAQKIARVPGVTRVAPMIEGQVLATANGRNMGILVYGQRKEDLDTIPLVNNPETVEGSLDRYEEGVAIGVGIADALGLRVGGHIKLISPDGPKTVFGVAPRFRSFEVVYIFGVGRYDIDRTRIYMPLKSAQSYFNRENGVDEMEIFVEEPEQVSRMIAPILAQAEAGAAVKTWQDDSGAFLSALEAEDNVMFIILSILVLIATMNIVSGLIMLVRNKGKDIGILRTVGLTEGSVLRVFFICGSSIGICGTVAGVILGCLFAIYIDPIFDAVNTLLGGGVWDPSVRYLSRLPARLEIADVASATALSLGLSFIITIFPARRAARMNPVEALRYE